MCLSLKEKGNGNDYSNGTYSSLEDHAKTDDVGDDLDVYRGSLLVYVFISY